MTSFGLTGFLLLVFYAGAAIGSRSGDHVVRLVRGLIPTGAGGILTFICFFAAQDNVRTAGGAIVYLAFIAVFFTVFLFGLGMLAGSLASWPKSGSIRKALLASILITPITLVGTGLYRYEVAVREKAEALIEERAEFLRETLTGSFGAHVVSIPVLPLAKITHACREERSVCHTSFGRSTALNNAKREALDLRTVEILSHEDDLSQLAAWCAERGAEVDPEWCAVVPLDRLVFRRHEDVRPEADTNGWTEVPSDASGTRVYCGAQSFEGFCRALIDVAPGIQAEQWFRDLEPAKVIALLPTARNRAEALWRAMQSG